MRSSDETEKSQASANPETPLGTQMSAGRRLAAAGGGGPEEGSWSRKVPPGSGGLGGRRGPGFSNSGETEVDSVVAKDCTAAAAAREGVITPTV